MVVFFDIDGTLIHNATETLPASAVRAVHRLRENGHIPVVNTGRPYSHLDPRITAMDFAGYICACGMEIRLDHDWLLRNKPAAEVCRAVRDLCRETRTQVLYEGDDGIVADGACSTHPLARREAESMAKKGFPVVEMDALPYPRFTKFVTFPDEAGDREAFVKGVSPWFACIDRITLLEFVPHGCSKAGGMATLLGHLGISKEDTLAIGDSANDIPMFEAASHTVCMADGMQVLKDRAEYITASVLDDGIEKALQHYGLI